MDRGMTYGVLGLLQLQCQITSFLTGFPFTFCQLSTFGGGSCHDHDHDGRRGQDIMKIHFDNIITVADPLDCTSIIHGVGDKCFEFRKLGFVMISNKLFPPKKTWS